MVKIVTTTTPQQPESEPKGAQGTQIPLSSPRVKVVRKPQKDNTKAVKA